MTQEGKRRLTAEERRQDIIAKATGIFANRGLHGTRTRDLARACGVNEALIYKHFCSKNDLYREVMTRLHSQFAMTAQKEAFAQPDGCAGITEMFRSLISSLDDNPQIAANILHGVGEAVDDANTRRQAIDRLKFFHSSLRDQLQRGIDDGSLSRDLDPDQTAWQLMGVFWTFAICRVLGMHDCFGLNAANEVCKSIVK
jgi:AcrR family transcriptional regulator